MTTSTLSHTAPLTLGPKFQIVIPKPLRQSLKLLAGQQIELRLKGDRIELIPIQPMRAARGLFAGINTDVPNDVELLKP